MFMLFLLIMILMSGVTAYAVVKYMMQVKRYGPIILLTAEHSRSEHGSFIQLRWKSRVSSANAKEEFIVQRKAGLQVFPSEIAVTYETELRDYDVCPGQTYTYIVYGGRDSTMGYDGKISNQAKVTT